MKIDEHYYDMRLSEMQIKDIVSALKLAKIYYVINYSDFEGSDRLGEIIKKMEDLINEINGNNKAEEKTYRYEVYCEIDVKASTGAEARKKLKEEYGSFFHTFIGIVNEDGEVEE